MKAKSGEMHEWKKETQGMRVQAHELVLLQVKGASG